MRMRQALLRRDKEGEASAALCERTTIAYLSLFLFLAAYGSGREAGQRINRAFLGNSSVLQSQAEQ